MLRHIAPRAWQLASPLQQWRLGCIREASGGPEFTSAVNVQAEGDLSCVLPSDLQEVLGISSNCWHWFEPATAGEGSRWYIAWGQRATNTASSDVVARSGRRLAMTRLKVMRAIDNEYSYQSIKRHAIHFAAHPRGCTLQVTNLPQFTEYNSVEVKDQLRQVFRGYSLANEAMFTDVRTSSALVGFTSPHEASMAARRLHGSDFRGRRLGMVWWDS